MSVTKPRTTALRPVDPVPRRPTAGNDERLAESDEAALAASLLDVLDSHPAEVAGIVSMVPVDYAPASAYGSVVQGIRRAVEDGDTLRTSVLRRILETDSPEREAIREALIDAARDPVNTGRRALDVARVSARRLSERVARREVAVAAEVLALSPGDADAADAVRKALSRVELAAGPARTCPSLSDYLDNWARQERKAKVRTGFAWFDEPTDGGLPVGGIVAVFAPPKSAKSALCLQLATGAMLADTDVRVVWARGEMTGEDFANRFLAVASGLVEGCDGVTLSQAERRTPMARRAAVRITQEFGDRITWVPPPLTVAAIEAEVVRTNARLLVIDYVQRLTLPDGGRDPVRDLDTIVGQLRDMTERRGIATIMVSSMAKPTSGTGSHLGQLGRGSVDIGHACEIGYEAVIKRDADGSPVEDSDGCYDVRWRCAGARNLRARDLVLRFQGNTQTYFDNAPETTTFPVAGKVGTVSFDDWPPPTGAI